MRLPFFPRPAPAPPPVPTPDQCAEILGVRSERHDSPYRCAECGRWQRANAWMFWIPDVIRSGDPAWAIQWQARQTNQGYSGQCLPCVERLAMRAAREP